MDFWVLLGQWERHLKRIALSMLDNEQDATEAFEDSIILAYSKFKQLRGGEKAFGAWIRQVVIHRCRQLQRERGRTRPTENMSDLLVAAQDSVETSFFQAVEFEALWEAVDNLDPPQRRVIMLRYVSELSQSEIAAIERVPIGTVKSRIAKALSQLRKTFMDEMEAEVVHYP